MEWGVSTDKRLVKIDFDHKQRLLTPGVAKRRFKDGKVDTAVDPVNLGEHDRLLGTAPGSHGRTSP